MKCSVCDSEKPEKQKFRQVNGEQIPLPCDDCYQKNLAAYQAAPKGAQYRHTKRIAEARKKKSS